MSRVIFVRQPATRGWRVVCLISLAPCTRGHGQGFPPRSPQALHGCPRLFNTKLWFHGTTILALFRALSELQSLKTKKNRTRSLADKATLNSAIKTAIERIKTDFLLYAISTQPEEADKNQKAKAILSAADLTLSVQVLQEFYVQATRHTRAQRRREEP